MVTFVNPIGDANGDFLTSLSPNPPEPKESHSTRNGQLPPRGHLARASELTLPALGF
jgi:hypothetical protein